MSYKADCYLIAEDPKAFNEGQEVMKPILLIMLRDIYIYIIITIYIYMYSIYICNVTEFGYYIPLNTLLTLIVSK